MGNLRDVDFLPLTVDVEEKHYAAGKVPGSYQAMQQTFGELWIGIISGENSYLGPPLTLDGAPWLALPAGEWRAIDVPRGAHAIEAVAGTRVPAISISYDEPSTSASPSPLHGT